MGKRMNKVKLMLLTFLGASSIIAPLANPVQVFAESSSSEKDINSKEKEKQSRKYHDLVDFDSSVISTKPGKDSGDLKVVAEKKAMDDKPIEERDLMLFTKNTKALTSYKKTDDIKAIRTVDLPDDVLINITGRAVYNNTIYYRAEMPQNEAAVVVDNYLDVKDEFTVFNPDPQVDEKGESQKDLHDKQSQKSERVNDNEGSKSENKEDAKQTKKKKNDEKTKKKNHSQKEKVKEVFNADTGKIEKVSSDQAENKDTKSEEEKPEEEKPFVFYLAGTEVKRKLRGEDIEDVVYAKNKTQLLLLDGKATPIVDINETDAIDVVKENDRWYFVDLKKTIENYDELDTEEELAIIEKRFTSKEEHFMPSVMALEAKEKTRLYTLPNKDKENESTYHVEKGNNIIQLERSANWVRLELKDGEVLFAPIKNFIESDQYEKLERRKKTYKVQVPSDNTTNQSKPKKTKTVKTKTIKIPVKDGEDAVGNQIAEMGLKYVGNRYVWGGNSLTNGVDCSGFTKEIYKRFGVNLPRYSGDQGKVGRSVSLAEAKPGDVVHYSGHVAIYIGNGKIVHAANSRKGIIVSGINYTGPYKSIRRIIE